MINPADLNDPAKARAFLRKTIDDLTAEIGELRTSAQENMRRFIELNGDDHDAVLKFTRRVQHRLASYVAPMEAHRDDLIKIIEQADAIRAAAPIVVDECHTANGDERPQ